MILPQGMLPNLDGFVEDGIDIETGEEIEPSQVGLDDKNCLNWLKTQVEAATTPEELAHVIVNVAAPLDLTRQLRPFAEQAFERMTLGTLTL